MPAIYADTSAIDGLVAQLRLAASYAGDVAAAVHRGLGLGELMIAAAVDPVGAARFEAAAFAVLTGPFGLAGLESEFSRLAALLVRTATDYLSVDGQLLAFDDLTAWLTPDGRPLVTSVGAVTATVPLNTFGLVANLTALNDTRHPGAGEIDIQTLVGADAAGQAVRKVIVYLPGTDSWDPVPRADVNDLTTNEAAIRGYATTYEDGVLIAMKAAGVTVADDVTLVGHSQGGLVAVNTARDAVQTGTFNVTHVLTVGAPIALAARDLPDSVQVLAIENRPDLVPRLDGAQNPRQPNLTTVEIDHNQGSILANHRLDSSYQPGAAEVDRQGGASVQRFLTGAVAPVQVESTTTARYGIRRAEG